MREDAIDKELKKFSAKWFIPFEDVKYEAYNFKDGEMSNANLLKNAADFAAYREANPGVMKFEFQENLIEDFQQTLMPEIVQLLES